MIKNLQNLIIAAGLLNSALSIAQPTLTSANTSPILGDVYVVKSTNYVAPGSAGASQVWNLSGMAATSTTNYTAVTVASTPNGASFPSANIAVTDGTNYAYLNGTPTLLQNSGIDGGGVVMSYSNLEDELHYPFNYTNTFNDSWATTFTNGLTFYRTGTSTVTADGYGTVTTPAGTFNNTLRVHLYQVYQDSANIGSPIIINYTNDEYFWYLPGNHYTVASVYSLTTNGSPTTAGSYLNVVTTGVNEHHGAFSSLNLYPNPSSQNINVNYEASGYQNISMNIFNSMGQKIKSLDNVSSFGVGNTLTVSVNDLPSGIYYLQMNGDGILSKQERFVIAK